MDPIKSIKSNNLNMFNSGTLNASKLTTSSLNESIWTTQNKTQKEDGTNQKILDKVNEEQMRIANAYTIEQEQKQAKKAEQILKNSSIPGLSNVGSQLKTKIDTLAGELRELVMSLLDKCANCQTTSDVEEKAKKVEQEIIQKRQEVVTYTQRMQKAVQLDAKISKLAADPEKSKLLTKIDLNKIESKFLEPTNLNNTGTESIGSNTDIENNTGNDDISNIITSIIKYIETGENNKQIDEYIKEDNNQQEPDKNTNFKLFTNNKNNLFSQNIMDDNRNIFLT